MTCKSNEIQSNLMCDAARTYGIMVFDNEPLGAGVIQKH